MKRSMRMASAAAGSRPAPFSASAHNVSISSVEKCNCSSNGPDLARNRLIAGLRIAFHSPFKFFSRNFPTLKLIYCRTECESQAGIILNKPLEIGYGFSMVMQFELLDRNLENFRELLKCLVRRITPSQLKVRKKRRRNVQLLGQFPE